MQMTNAQTMKGYIWCMRNNSPGSTVKRCFCKLLCKNLRHCINLFEAFYVYLSFRRAPRIVWIFIRSTHGGLSSLTELVYREWRRSNEICALVRAPPGFLSLSLSQRSLRRIHYRNLPPCQARTPDSDFEARFCCNDGSRIEESSRPFGELEIDLTSGVPRRTIFHLFSIRGKSDSDKKNISSPRWWTDREREKKYRLLRNIYSYMINEMTNCVCV